MVDNTGLMPNAFPDHFFVTGGPGVWAAMTQNEYIAARSLRLVEEAINAQPASSRSKLVDIKSCVTSPIHRGAIKTLSCSPTWPPMWHSPLWQTPTPSSLRCPDEGNPEGGLWLLLDRQSLRAVPSLHLV